MRRIIWIGILVGLSQGIFAQLSLGLVNGNFSGVSGSLINPSSMANSKLSADINIFSARTFVENNYLYFPSRKASLVKLVNGAYDYELFPKPFGTGNRYVYSYYSDKSLKNAYVNTRIMGPSFMFTRQDHVFALRTGARFMSSTRRLPYDMANFSYYTMDFRPQHNTYFVRDNYDMSSMAWYEVMASYVTVFNRGKSNLWSAGISAGPLFGYAGAYVKGGDTRYIVYNEDILNVEQLDAEFGMSLPVDYNSNETDYYHPSVRGFGWGMDVGITWQYRDKPYQRRIPRNCYKKRFEEYQFKLGISLIDIGYINFNRNAERHVYENVHNNWIKVSDFNYTNIHEGLNYASELFYGDSTASLRGNSIRIYLPTSLSVQFDYHVANNWFVNGTAVIPVKYASPMIEAPVVIAVTPRYESRFLEVQLPLVLYDFNNPRIGLSLRFDGLTIGTDNFLCFTSTKDFTGADVYISYRIMLRNDGKNPYSNRGACYNNWRTQIKLMHKG
jgi:hypothetical protein